jgi:glycosyltransferase involved in cell wall biosynthesis
MAGMGIRALELARALGGEFDVRLLVPNNGSDAGNVAPDLKVSAVATGKLASAAEGADAAVVSGHAANWWFHQVPDVPVAVDLYDPFFIENLHYASALGPEPAVHDHATLDLALRRADFFLCASPEQWLFYAGALYVRGRVGARNFAQDPTLSGLLCQVPFGVPAEVAQGSRPAGRQAMGLEGEGPVVLFGGIYDWYEPDLLLEAWAAVVRKHPDAKLVFFENPNPESTPQRVYAEARQRARGIDPRGKTVFFSPWLPYRSRADLYAAVDLLVTISSPGLETDLAFRTRLLDAAWGGVSSVSIRGGPLARDLELAGAGRSLPPSSSALAEEISALLADPAERQKRSEAARRFAAARAWSGVTAPLAAWCREARVDPGRLPLPSTPRSFWRRLASRQRR